MLEPLGRQVLALVAERASARALPDVFLLDVVSSLAFVVVVIDVRGVQFHGMKRGGFHDDVSL